MRKILSLSVISLLAACGSSSSIKTTDLPENSENCPYGGVQIDSGGKTTIICNGANGTVGDDGTMGYSSLIERTVLATGDANCEAGGVMIVSGIDNGAGEGGVASDSILQTGEIVGDPTYVCNLSSSEKVGSLDPPSTADGTAAITTNGGEGQGTATYDDGVNPVEYAGYGGNAGGVDIKMVTGSNGGHVKVFKNTIPTAPTVAVPSKSDFSFGKLPTVFEKDDNEAATNCVVDTDNSNTGVSITGSVVAWQTSTGAWACAQCDNVNGVDWPSAAAQAIYIKANCRVKMANITYNILGSCVNAGRITSTGNNFTLNCQDYYGTNTSSIDSSGLLQGSVAEAGGNININTAYSFYNSGSIVLSADDPANSSSTDAKGGNLTITATNGSIYNAGAITSIGSNPITNSINAASGGTGGDVTLAAAYHCYNSGAITTDGGPSPSSLENGLQAGGDAGAVKLLAGGDYTIASQDYVGTLLNTGAISAKGGQVSSGCSVQSGAGVLQTRCDAGNGGNVLFAAANGSLTSTGTIATTGGSTITAADLRNGGNGGTVDFIVVTNHNSPISTANILIPSGSITISGAIDTSGGSGSIGGDGKKVTVSLDPGLLPNGQEIVLYGYTSLVAKGGNGKMAEGDNSDTLTDYGNGAAVNISTTYGTLANSNVKTPGGAVINYANIDTRGGSVTPATSLTDTDLDVGLGGKVSLTTQQNSYFVNTSDTEYEVAKNYGSITTTGGSCVGGTGISCQARGGDAGSIGIYGRAGVNNDANVTFTAMGGGSTDGIAGNGAPVSIGSDDGLVYNRVDIVTSGGEGANGGDAAKILLVGMSLDSNADLNAAGGNDGGDGANIEILSLSGFSTARGTMIATGEGTGADGIITKDGRVEISN
ncbi:MAG: hypothetical protein JW841_06035 [Deltaproteobacteria bacterium]|nr:hypothetical protein [Deltaproteobacteria bacterium]